MEGLVRSLSIGVGWDVNNKGLVEADQKTDGLIDSADRAEDEMNQLGRAGNQAGNKITRAFSAAGNKIKSGMQVLADYRYELMAMSATGAAGIFGLSKMAGNAQETVNKFNVVFGEVADNSRQWADEFSNAIGRSEYATLDWLNSFQDVLVPMGLARDEAAGLSQEMVKLAADLGSFNNVPTAEAARAMQSALVGNHEAVRKLGIQLSATQLDLVAQKEGYEENFRNLDNLSKMQLRFREMIRQSSDAVGDAKRTSDEYNNQILALKGNLRDLGIAIGNSYIPNMTDGLNVTNDFLSSLTESEWTKPIARVLALGTAFAGLAAGVGVVYALAGAIGIGAAPLAGIVAGIGLLILIVEDLWTGFQGGESVIFNLIGWLGDFFGTKSEFKEFKEIAIGYLNDIWIDAKRTVEGLIDFFTGLGQIIAGAITFDKDLLNEGWNNLVQGGLEAFDGFGSMLMSVLEGSVELGFGLFEISVEALWEIGKNIALSINYGIENAFGIDIIGFFKESWNTAKEWWNTISTLSFDFEMPDIKGLINEKIQSLPDWSKKLLGVENEVIEKESKNIQKNNSTKINNNDNSVNLEKGAIQVNESENPRSTAKEVQKQLDSYFGKRAGEVGAK